MANMANLVSGKRKLVDGKIALVTGANRGIGKSISEVLASEGATVILLGRNEKALLELKREFDEQNWKSGICVCDLSKDDRISEAVKEVVDSYGHIDILVNNAGIETDMDFLEMPMDMFDEMMRFNFRQLAIMSKAVIPHMIEHGTGGSIINIGSAAGERGLPGSTAYSASKAAVICFTQVLGEEMRPHNIRVNVLNPGLIDTELFWKSATADYLMEKCGDIIPLETVGYYAAFLGSDMSEGITCQSMCVRGISRW